MTAALETAYLRAWMVANDLKCSMSAMSWGHSYQAKAVISPKRVGYDPIYVLEDIFQDHVKTMENGRLYRIDGPEAANIGLAFDGLNECMWRAVLQNTVPENAGWNIVVDFRLELVRRGIPFSDFHWNISATYRFGHSGQYDAQTGRYPSQALDAVRCVSPPVITPVVGALGSLLTLGEVIEAIDASISTMFEALTSHLNIIPGTPFRNAMVRATPVPAAYNTALLDCAPVPPSDDSDVDDPLPEYWAAKAWNEDRPQSEKAEPEE